MDLRIVDTNFLILLADIAVNFGLTLVQNLFLKFAYEKARTQHVWDGFCKLFYAATFKDS